MGGLELLKNQLIAVKQIYKDNVGIYLLESNSNSQLGELVDHRVSLVYPSRYSAPWFFHIGTNRVTHFVRNSDHFIGSVLRKNNIDAIFGMGLSYRYDGVPSLAWLSDFQHRHYPEFFSEGEKRTMNAWYLKIARSSSRVLLYSHAVKRDFETFLPRYADKARVLHPVASIPEQVYQTDPKAVVTKYHLPEKFFYFPNNFAKHKNHEVVFRAVQQLKRDGDDVSVVCTGVEDSRRPGSFATLWRNVSELGIRNRIIYLGLVPHDELLLLMRQSICVLSPSLFEGWGLTVDEARSVGKRLLISDILPFKEQDPPNATYVNPTDSIELANKMSEIWTRTAPGPDLVMEASARQQEVRRIRENAERFIGLVSEATNE
jgi:glycosyltransferase involved in cell wall biosynthesis